MEHSMVQHLTQHLLTDRFVSKREMAEQVGISYHTLLNTYSGKSTKQTAIDVTNKILRYCIRQRVSLEALSYPVV